MCESRVPGKSDIRVRLPAGNVLFPALPMKVGLKPSLATTTAKASERVIADLLGWDDARLAWETTCFPRHGKSGVTMRLATKTSKGVRACDRGPSGLG
ncbi:MAG TPA: hypothetical protein VIM32_03045 [Desulfosporosinus sp.]